MRSFPSIVAAAFLACACASAGSARQAEAAPPQAPRTCPAEAILSETVIATQTVERDGLRCLQGLDSYGNVVEESCVAASDAD